MFFICVNCFIQLANILCVSPKFWYKALGHYEHDRRLLIIMELPIWHEGDNKYIRRILEMLIPF